jgi:ADP-heptose:LPS heptosyltransferase
MLTWPALADVRVALPEARIAVLVSPVVEEVAHACPYVDDVIIDDGKSIDSLIETLAADQYDAAVALYSTPRIAWVLHRARIRYRLAPATKLHQVFFNRRLKQRRSWSLKPEYEYNRDLTQRLLIDHNVEIQDRLPEPPFWKIPPNSVKRASSALKSAHSVPDEARLVIIHPGSGGSARNLTVKQYAELANQLKSDHSLFALVTAGPGEADQANALAEMITEYKAAAYASTDGLVAFAQTLAQAALFVSGSTGPLHIAGALDVPTLAFYPHRRSSTALRWQTTNRVERRLAFSPPLDADEQDMQAIDLAQAAQEASVQFLGASRG